MPDFIEVFASHRPIYLYGAVIALAYVGQRDTTWLTPRRCQTVIRVRKIAVNIYKAFVYNPTDTNAFYFVLRQQVPEPLFSATAPAPLLFATTSGRVSYEKDREL